MDDVCVVGSSHAGDHAAEQASSRREGQRSRLQGVGQSAAIHEFHQQSGRLIDLQYVGHGDDVGMGQLCLGPAL